MLNSFGSNKFKIILFLIITVNSITALCFNCNFFGAGIMPTCFVHTLNITIPENQSETLNILILNDTQYRSYKLKELFYILLDPIFDPRKRTVIYAHGFTQGPFNVETARVAKAYYDTGLYNVLLLDARHLLCFDYISSVAAVQLIGKRLAEEILELSQWGFNVSTLELVGHSLGAHIMGKCGKTFYSITGTKLPFITGLDPAGPCYGLTPSSRRLDRNDADFVQAIHTNGGIFGLMKDVGHVDFYINGGRTQPQLTPFAAIFCDHERAVEMWPSVISNPGKFVGKKCKNVKEIDDGICINAEDSPSTDVTMSSTYNKDVDKGDGVYLVITTAIYPYYLPTLDTNAQKTTSKTT